MTTTGQYRVHWPFRPLSGPNRLSLPWPMSTVEMFVHLLSVAVFVLGGWAVAVWAGSAVFEPSLWRLVPLLGWPFVAKAVLRLVVPWFEPSDSAQRWRSVVESERS